MVNTKRDQIAYFPKRFITILKISMTKLFLSSLIQICVDRASYYDERRIERRKPRSTMQTGTQSKQAYNPFIVTF